MKKSFFSAIYFVIFCMSGLFAGCDRDGPGGPTTTTSIRYYTTTTTSIRYYTTTTTSIRTTTTTATGLTVTQAEATPADNTKVLDNDALNEITDFSDDGKITFDADSKAANLLEVGDIIAAGISSATPYGMLRKVISKSQYGSEIIVTTEQATLEEAFEELTLDFTHTMSQSNTSNFVALKRGLSLVKRPNSSASLFGYEVNLDDLEIYDYDGNPYTTNDRVAADGSFKFSVDYKVSVDISWFTLEQLEFRTDIDESSELDVAWNYALQQAVEQEVAKWTASPITIMAGAVPLVFVPELVLNVGASASVDASLSTGYEQTFDYWTSLTWERESELWSKTQDVNKQFSYSPPSLDASISAEAYLKPQLDILLYGLAGPKASTKGYLSFDADIDECPWWSLDLGIDVLVGIAPGVFSDDIEYNLPAFQLVAPYEIASADSCFTGGGDTTTTTTSITGSDYGTIAGNIKDAANNQPVSGVNVTVYNASNSVLGSGYSDSSGSYSIDVISGTGYKVVYTKIGYFTTTNNNVTVTANTTTNLEAALVIDESYSGTGSISGTVTDATTGTGLGGVSLCLREGMGSKSGSCVASTTTDSSGAYSFSSINAGVYTVEATKSGYITGHFTVACLGGTTTTDQNGSISPALSSDEYRIVLTWGESPSDLDSHLFGPTSTGGTFHISWEGKVADNGYVNLDVDDIYSYGPETITISHQLDGTYRYLVHDYTNYASSSSTALANSGAQVNVYKGSALVATFNVPSGAGTLWTVFELNDDDKTPIDTITGNGPPYSMRVLTRGNRVKTIKIGAPWFRHVPEKSR